MATSKTLCTYMNEVEQPISLPLALRAKRTTVLEINDTRATPFPKQYDSKAACTDATARSEHNNIAETTCGGTHAIECCNEFAIYFVSDSMASTTMNNTVSNVISDHEIRKSQIELSSMYRPTIFFQTVRVFWLTLCLLHAYLHVDDTLCPQILFIFSTSTGRCCLSHHVVDVCLNQLRQKTQKHQSHEFRRKKKAPAMLSNDSIANCFINAQDHVFFFLQHRSASFHSLLRDEFPIDLLPLSEHLAVS